MAHPAFKSASVAVVTGGASGIGLACAAKFAQMGMCVVIVDLDKKKLAEAELVLRETGAKDVMTSATDVADLEQVSELEMKVADRFGGTDILMNNAGVGIRSSCAGPREAWEKMLGVNLWGAINGCQVFLPRMISRGRSGAIINTGSKQGITTPPGNPGYNVSKAALKAYTEALSHELRNTEDAKLTAHLLVPGFVHTNMIGATEKPPSAWTAEQTADFFIESVNRGDFYVLCPDNDVSREIDEKRIAWATGDIIHNRPALSRWHPEYEQEFADYMSKS